MEKTKVAQRSGVRREICNKYDVSPLLYTQNLLVVIERATDLYQYLDGTRNGLGFNTNQYGAKRLGIAGPNTAGNWLHFWGHPNNGIWASLFQFRIMGFNVYNQTSYNKASVGRVPLAGAPTSPQLVS